MEKLGKNNLVQDRLDLSKLSIPDMKRRIFHTYEKLALLYQEEFSEEESKIVYFFHGLKIIKEEEDYEILDCSDQIVNDKYYLNNDDPNSLVIVTEYSQVKNKFFLYLILKYIEQVLKNNE